MKNSLIILVLIFNINVTNATTFYMSNHGNDYNSGISFSFPWKTFDKLQKEANSRFIKPGDSILFRSGEIYSGRLKWMNIWGMNCLGGTKSNPIYFSCYGKGAKPMFICPDDPSISPENNILFHFAGVNNIIIDGLQFKDLKKTGNKLIPGNCGIPIYLGAMNEATCNNFIIKNIDIVGYGMGPVIIGDYNKITNCSMKDFVNLKSTFGFKQEYKYDDYGANAITITGNYNIIANNFISGAWAESLDYGWNGGAFEFFNSCSFNRITGNKIIDCAGLAEFGGVNKNELSQKNIFEFNTIINCGSMIWTNLSGNFAAEVRDTYFSHNLVNENDESRFTGKNTGLGIISQQAKKLIYSESVLFSHNGKENRNYVYIIRNNRFKIKKGISILKQNDEKSIQQYNFLNDNVLLKFYRYSMALFKIKCDDSLGKKIKLLM